MKKGDIVRVTDDTHIYHNGLARIRGQKFDPNYFALSYLWCKRESNGTHKNFLEETDFTSEEINKFKTEEEFKKKHPEEFI